MAQLDGASTPNPKVEAQVTGPGPGWGMLEKVANWCFSYYINVCVCVSLSPLPVPEKQGKNTSLGEDKKELYV